MTFPSSSTLPDPHCVHLLVVVERPSPWQSRESNPTAIGADSRHLNASCSASLYPRFVTVVMIFFDHCHLAGPLCAAFSVPRPPPCSTEYAHIAEYSTRQR